MKNKAKITAAAAGLSALMTGAVIADSDCGVPTLAADGVTHDQMIPGYEEKNEYARGRLEDIMDSIVCMSKGLNDRYGNFTEMTSDDIEFAARLKELSRTSLIAGVFQDNYSKGPVTMQVSGPHHTIYFNPIMSEQENAEAGLALLKMTIERSLTGVGTYGEYTYRNGQATHSPQIEINSAAAAPTALTPNP